MIELGEKLLQVVSKEGRSRLIERDLGLEIGPRDSGWSGEAIAEWEAEVNLFFAAPKTKAGRPSRS